MSHDYDFRPTTKEVNSDGSCPECGSPGDWIPYFCPEDHERGIMCHTCGLHLVDEESDYSFEDGL